MGPGILVGGGSFPYKDESHSCNTNIQIRNSTAHDVYGDGIVLFRDAHSSIRNSAAWEIGMEPTQDVGTPDAIWVWTCSECVVADNEAYLTDSPGVDGGAYDIDWNNQHVTIERNFAHDTQGYCISVFPGAGYVTRSDSMIRDNLCIDNGLRSAHGGFAGCDFFEHVWNGGQIKGLTVKGNEIHWNPPVPGAAAIEGPGDDGGMPWMFANNTIESTSPLIYRIKAPWQSFGNKFVFDGDPVFAIGEKKTLSLEALLAQGIDSSSKIVQPEKSKQEAGLRLDALIVPSFDQDGLLSEGARSQLVVLRDLAGQYGPRQLQVTVHLPPKLQNELVTKAVLDLNDVYPDSINFDYDAPAARYKDGVVLIRIQAPDGVALREWHSFQNAAILGGVIRKLLGPPDYSHTQPLEHHEGQP